MDKYRVGQMVRIARAGNYMPQLAGRVATITRPRERHIGANSGFEIFTYTLDINIDGIDVIAPEDCLAPLDPDFCVPADRAETDDLLRRIGWRPHVTSN